jgi:hypothetical protein
MQLQQEFNQLQQQQKEHTLRDENNDIQEKRQRIRLRLTRVTRDVSDLNILLKNLSEGKNVPMALLVQDKRQISEAEVSGVDEEVRCRLLCFIF